MSSDISWSALHKPYGAMHSKGRRRSAYNVATLRRAITEGIDPSLNKLGVGMPQFEMSDTDMASLIAYLKRLETDFDPGVTDKEIVVVTMLRRHEARGSPAESVEDLLTARFKDVNDGGGVYGRMITLRILDATDRPATSVAALRDFLKSHPVFAVIAPFIPGASVELASLARERGIPIVVPLAGPPIDVDESNRFVFYLHAGLDTQARVLVDDLSAQSGWNHRSSYAIVSQCGRPFEQLANAVTDRAKKRGLDTVSITTCGNARASKEQLTNFLRNVDGVFLLGPDAEVSRWLTYVRQDGASPKILMVSASLGEMVLAASQSCNSILSVAFPNTNSAQSPGAQAAFRAFRARHGLTGKPSAAGLAAYSAASLFLEGVRNAGKQLRREGLIRELEGLYEFHTGLTRDITYGPTRRVGVRGAYVVTFDPNVRTRLPNSRWIEFMP